MKIFTQKTLLILYSNNIKNLFISILHGYINIKLHLTHTPEPINIGEFYQQNDCRKDSYIYLYLLYWYMYTEKQIIEGKCHF